MTHPLAPGQGPQESSRWTWWSEPTPGLLEVLDSTAGGLADAVARERLARHGPNCLGRSAPHGSLTLLLGQFTSPIILILLAAALLSLALDSLTEALIILTIVLVSGLLGFWQERGAARAIGELLAVVELQSTVLRDGQERAIPMADLVRGDVVVLAAGDGVPADCRLLEERDLSVDEAALTGESEPVGKATAPVPPEAPLPRRSNALFLGTHVVSGTGRAVVVRTGRATHYGSIAESLRQRSGETAFELGVRRFGNLLLEVTLILVGLIFAFNVYLQRPVADSFLFALALGVGLTPQLLPAIISVNLAQGARSMARRRVIVKRLASIENFGSMDVLCSDKTGTLTEGMARLQRALAADGEPSRRVLEYACLNAAFETGYPNPIDTGLRELAGLPTGWHKLDERPFDFHRKRLSVLLQPPAEAGPQPELITKGALAQVLAVCTLAERADGHLVPLPDLEPAIATDRVDPDWIARPRRWDIAFIQRFMLCFGLVSSVFDFLTFAVLLLVLRSDPAHFRTGWFVESVVSAASIVLVVRTRGPMLASRPSRALALATLLVVIATLLLPTTPLGRLFGFVPLPPPFLVLLSLILLGYVLAAELVKRWFYTAPELIRHAPGSTAVSPGRPAPGVLPACPPPPGETR